MENFADILKSHALAYPVMQPCDAIKLVYQSVFGGGHMIKGGDALERLKDEYTAVSHEGKRHIEPLGDTSRVYIDRELCERELTLIAGIFAASSKSFPLGYSDADEESKKRFRDRIEAVKGLAGEGSFGFDSDALNLYLHEYFETGCPAVSHSEAYRRAYSPVYRVIDSRYVRLFGCIAEIDRLLSGRVQNSPPAVVAIDGRAASGKTTAAQLISEAFASLYTDAAEVVHMDDFFLPFSLRTGPRLAEPGGNLHRERFLSEVLTHIRDRDGFAYREFDCSTGDYKPEPRRIKLSRLIICEGAYALHPSFGKYYDLAVFSTVAPEEQERRILARGGTRALDRFKSAWIPMEERYFEAFGTIDKCDIIV